MGGGKVILIITAMDWHLMTNFTPTIYMQIWEKMSLAISSGGKNECDSCVVKDAVQSSYNNIADVTYEKNFLNMGLYDKKIYRDLKNFLINNNYELSQSVPVILKCAGVTFLPWWKRRFHDSELRYLSRQPPNHRPWPKRHYFYYLIVKKRT